MKLVVENISEFDFLLKGIIKIVEGCCIEVNSKGATLNINSVIKESKIRAFIKTTLFRTENEADTCELCFEQLNKFIQAISFLKDTGIEKEVELETDGIFLSYKGKSKFKLKLDKRERVENYITPPIKTELEDLFSFRINQEQINFITKYSGFNDFITVKGYFYLKENSLYLDIDNKSEARVSTVSIPLTEKYEGNLETPFILDLEDIKKFSIIDPENIKVNFCGKCVRVVSLRKCESGHKTAMQMIVRLLKND